MPFTRMGIPLRYIPTGDGHVSTMRTSFKTKAGIIVGLSIAATIIAAYTNPLRKPEATIQLWLQEKTPLGTSFTNVQSIIEAEGWFNPKSQGADGYAPEIYLRGYLGEYRSIPIPLLTSVTIFWEFDKERILRNIRVVKTVDSL